MRVHTKENILLSFLHLHYIISITHVLILWWNVYYVHVVGGVVGIESSTSRGVESFTDRER